MPPKDKPSKVKPEPKGKQRAAGKKTEASDEGANWLKEAWRRAGFTPINGSTIAAKAEALGLRASAVMTAPRPAAEPEELSSSSSSLSFTSLSQPTPRTTASAWKTKAAAPLAVRSVRADASLLFPSSVTNAALRAHHKRKLVENHYVTGQCYFEAQSVSNKLTHRTGEERGSKSLRSLYAYFYGGSMAQL
jgi:hypothetical protein